jgi:coenzyme F420-0:L-glutamate ligase/coenzyme F420-1:gamma-L-glutamate ligase
VSGVELIGLGDLGRPDRGDDLADAIATRRLVRSGDVVVVARLVVASVEGRIVAGDRGALVTEQSRRVMRHRTDGSVVAETHHGFVLVDAGVVATGSPGRFALIPDDPDRSARRVRDGLMGRHDLHVSIVVAEAAFRPWRRGIEHIAIGHAFPADTGVLRHRPDALAAAAGLLLAGGIHAAVAIRGLDGSTGSDDPPLADGPPAGMDDQLFR